MKKKKFKFGYNVVVATKLQDNPVRPVAGISFCADHEFLYIYSVSLFVFKKLIEKVPKDNLSKIKLINLLKLKEKINRGNYEDVSVTKESTVEYCSNKIQNIDTDFHFLQVEWDHGSKGIIVFMMNHIISSRDGQAQYAWETLVEETGFSKAVT